MTAAHGLARQAAALVDSLPEPHREPFRGRPRGAGLSVVQVPSAVISESLRTGHAVSAGKLPT
ncbi:hypothetical protein ACFYO2_04265 [Streptomyces sp. NPDC006602]|uniref:hypothetical protein n=1 Tax=Streptomyces sp. NPDC006602 TaxID=3364751 RepID=UPI00368339FB